MTCPGAVPLARQRHMGHEFAGLGRDAGTLQGRIDLALEECDGLPVTHARPQRMRRPAAEFADPHERQRKSRRLDLRQRIVDGGCVAPVDLADETQREMQLAAALPAGTRDARLQVSHSRRNRVGQCEGDEQANHAVDRRSGRRFRNRNTTAP